MLLVSFFSGVSLFNYFTNRQYLDLDMVTPWEEIADDIDTRAKPGDGIAVGAFPRPRGFYHYYKGELPVLEMQTENPEAQLSDLLKQHERIWVFLTEEPFRKTAEEWMKSNSDILFEKGYLYEEQTLKGLREGLKNIHKYKSYIYKLYLIRTR